MKTTETTFYRFKQDVARWIVPQQVMPIENLTLALVLRLIYLHSPLQAMALFRLGCWLKQKGVRAFPTIIQRLLFHWYGLEMVIGSDIGGGLYIAHTIGTVIVPERMGRNCSIIAAVTIGMRNEHRFPIIGDEVFIGAGARVLGGIQIGDGAKIGANAVVIADVPSNTTAVGVPAKIIGLETTQPLKS